MTDYKDLIAEARELAEKATPGPWRDTNGYGDYILASSEKGGVFPVAQVRGYGYFHGSGSGALGLSEKDADKIMDANAAFIARSRTLVPELCDAWEKTQDALDTLVNQFHKDCSKCNALKDAQRWIPVTERLPDKWRNNRGEPIEFNVMLPDAIEATTLCFNGSQWFAFDWKNMKVLEYYDVVRWQPLPAPPEKEGEPK